MPKTKPIQSAVSDTMNELAPALEAAFNGPLRGRNRVYGFMLAVFEFGDTPARFNYISNANRADMAALLREMADKFAADTEGSDGSQHVN